MRLSYSAHAKEKVRIRKLSKNQIRLVLESPDGKFYDVAKDVSIAVKEFDHPDGRVGLIVVFVVGRKGSRVVTVYPVKDVQKEIVRKVNAGRWLPVAR